MELAGSEIPMTEVSGREGILCWTGVLAQGKMGGASVLRASEWVATLVASSGEV